MGLYSKAAGFAKTIAGLDPPASERKRREILEESCHIGARAVSFNQKFRGTCKYFVSDITEGIVTVGIIYRKTDVNDGSIHMICQDGKQMKV